MLWIWRLFIWLLLCACFSGASNDAPPLTVLVPFKASFTEFVSCQHNQSFHGFSIRVFEEAVKAANFTRPFRYKFVCSGNHEIPYDDLIDLLQEKKVDAIVGDITITNHRIQKVDFTQPYTQSALLVVVPVSSTSSQSIWRFLHPFSWKLWAAIATAFIGTGIVILILEQHHNTDFQGPLHRRLLNVYWFIALSLFFSQRDTIHTQPGRLVTVLWLLVVLIFTSSYTANLSSSLTSEGLSTEITGFESLKRLDVPVGYQMGSFTYEYLTRLGIEGRRLVPLHTELDYKDALGKGPEQAGGVAAIVDERPYFTKLLASDCSFKIVGNELAYFGGLGFAFPKNSSLTQKVSLGILSIAKNGTLQAIKSHALGTNTCGFQTPAPHLKVTNFLGLFKILGGVNGLSILWHLGKRVRIAASNIFFHVIYIVRNVGTSLWMQARKGQRNGQKTGMRVHQGDQEVSPDNEIDMPRQNKNDIN